MRYSTIFFSFLPLLAQNRLRVGLTISPQGKLTGIDTVFRLSGNFLTLWGEVRFTTPLEWDTLWVVVRCVGKSPVVYSLYRTKADSFLYRGKLIFRGSGIYFLTVLPPRQTRLFLAGKRIYITDAQFPTIANLRATVQQKAQASAFSAQVIAPDPSGLDELEVTPEALVGGRGETFSISEDLLEAGEEIDIEIPELEVIEEDFQLEDIDQEDL